MSRQTVRMSVRAVVETTHHESDLSPAAGAAQRMREGAAAHRARQSRGAAADDTYRHEIALSADYEGEALLLHVSGRADAIFTRADGVQVIEEIKLGAADMPLIPAHMAQAAVYGHMLCAAEGLKRVCLRVLYVGAQGEALNAYEQERGAQDLLAEFDALCAPAEAWEARKIKRRERRDASLAALPFPYDAYRAGQRTFAANAYVAIRERKRLFAQAPTGIGKTMAALYPALRAVGEGKCAKALFLTARNTGRKSAMDAMARLIHAGAEAAAVEIAAKDKVCLQDVRDCRPESCPYAKGFYDRLPGALHEALGMSLLDRDAVTALSRRHSVCPFELSLALAQMADVVVCDYNYVFDPFVSLQLLASPGGACLLVDEAHQLAPRVRDAYSAVLDAGVLRGLRRDAGKALGRKHALYKALTGAIHTLEELAQQEDFAQLDAPPESLARAMCDVQEAAGEALSRGGGRPAADGFALSAAWLLAAERFDGRYALLSQGEGRHARIELALLDASPEILAQTRRARGTVFFSATLAPFDASSRMLGTEDGDACLALPSPFSPAQLRVDTALIDIRYRSREQTAPDAAAAIVRHIRENPGHAIAFFPSYAYMGRIAELLLGMEELPDMELLRERKGMTEDEKNALLRAFEGDERTVLLAVLGGAFSEGIDLPGKRLENVIIVSTGMPQPDGRLRAMQAYYDAMGENGFDLCMTVPGMVRVIQAAGRLIRTNADTGTLLLIDSRYSHARIRALLSGTLIADALARQEADGQA